VNCIDNDGQTPLHRAFDCQMVVFLVAAGANVNARDERVSVTTGNPSCPCLSPQVLMWTDVASTILTKSNLSAVRLPRCDLTLCAVVQLMFALGSHHCDSMHCICARFCNTRAVPCQWWTIATASTVKHFHQH
jgi:hypothetical protein